MVNYNVYWFNILKNERLNKKLPEHLSVTDPKTEYLIIEGCKISEKEGSVLFSFHT